jgi:glucose-1-phosphate thymidylyltransferase
MIKKGIILAGGHGTRLGPLTKAVNKQLLPLYEKPLIYYPLSVLMLAGIRNILIITNRNEKSNFMKLLGDGSQLGIKIKFLEQDTPRGLPDAFIVGEKFIGKDSVVLILGDNFFYGQGFTNRLKKALYKNKGATIFTYVVKNPSDYGILETDKKNKIKKIIEKPSRPKSNLAITGLYFFNHKAVNFAKTLKPSKRNELEIVDLLNIYLKNKSLKSEFMGRGSAWLDTGNATTLFNASQYIAAIEERQGLKIACIEEISYQNKWISKKQIFERINFYGKCDYSDYLKKII